MRELLTARYRQEPGRVGGHFRGSSSTPYRVSMEMRGDADDPTALAEPRCSCPSAADEGFCKHMPLLAMAYLDDPASFPAVAEDLADLQDESKPMRAEAGICAGHAALLRGEPFAVVYRDRQMTIWRRCKNCDAVPPMESLVLATAGPRSTGATSRASGRRWSTRSPARSGPASLHRAESASPAGTSWTRTTSAWSKACSARPTPSRSSPRPH